MIYYFSYVEADGDEFMCEGLGGLLQGGFVRYIQKNYVKRSQFNTKNLKRIWG